MKSRYLAFWKPYGVLSQFTPEAGSAHRTLKDFIAIPDIYPVGRLDWDSEGLMLLSDDGALQHRWTDPKFHHPRTYWAQVEGTPGDDANAALRRGVKVQDYTSRPAKVRLLADGEADALPARETPIRERKNIPTAWIELELTEGRNRQVRRMTASVGLPTLRLIRVRMGPLALLDLALAPGEHKAIPYRSLIL